MKPRALRWTSLATLVVLTSSAFANVYQNRCRELADQGVNLISYSAPQSLLITKWLIACYQNKYALQLQENQYLMDVGPDGKPSARPMFPLFAKEEVVNDPTSITGIRVVDTNPRQYIFPIAAIEANPATAPCDIPEDYRLVHFCGSGCYTPDQSLFFPSGWTKIGEAQSAGLKSIVTLSQDSTFERLEYQSTPIRQFVTDPEDRKQEILRLEMRSGNELKVTTNHPLIDESGRVRRADSLKVGESLVEANGDKDPIVAIQPIEYFGKVINVDVDSSHPQNNIVLAQGYLNGSYAFQNEGVVWLNRVLLRSSLVPKELTQ